MKLLYTFWISSQSTNYKYEGRDFRINQLKSHWNIHLKMTNWIRNPLKNLPFIASIIFFIYSFLFPPKYLKLAILVLYNYSNSICHILFTYNLSLHIVPYYISLTYFSVCLFLYFLKYTNSFTNTTDSVCTILKICLRHLNLISHIFSTI